MNALHAAGPEHWDDVYASKQHDELSWFQLEPTRSLRLLASSGALPLSVIDVGGGESALVDHLLARGVAHVTVLDISARALHQVVERLGERPDLTEVVADVVAWRPDRAYGAWHDRAVLHFLTDDDDRAAYARIAADAVEPGGLAVIGGFGPDGPESCSGLPVRRADAASLAALFAPWFDLEHTEDERHVTPWGGDQQFTWVVLRRRP